MFDRLKKSPSGESSCFAKLPPAKAYTGLGLGPRFREGLPCKPLGGWGGGVCFVHTVLRGQSTPTLSQPQAGYGQ